MRREEWDGGLLKIACKRRSRVLRLDETAVERGVRWRAGRGAGAWEMLACIRFEKDGAAMLQEVVQEARVIRGDN